MPISRVHAKVLEKAALLLGGAAALADYLHVSQEQLDGWMRAESTLPTPLFISAVDLIETRSTSDGL